VRSLRGQTKAPGEAVLANSPTSLCSCAELGSGKGARGPAGDILRIRQPVSKNCISQKKKKKKKQKTKRRISTFVSHSMPEQELSFGWPQHGERGQEKGAGESRREAPRQQAARARIKPACLRSDVRIT